MKLKTKLQDEDFELGEVVEAAIFYGDSNGFKVGALAAKGGYHEFYFGSLKELTGMFEDYEEPKDHWYINYQGEVYVLNPNAVPDYSRNAKQIGNYFETKEEAEKALEKLKAWKRLKDKRFRFKRWKCENQRLSIVFVFDKESWATETEPDLDLLFGGEE